MKSSIFRRGRSDSASGEREPLIPAIPGPSFQHGQVQIRRNKVTFVFTIISYQWNIVSLLRFN